MSNAYVHFLGTYFEGTDLVRKSSLAHLVVRIGLRDRNRSAIKTRRHPSSSHKLRICGSPIARSRNAGHTPDRSELFAVLRHAPSPLGWVPSENTFARCSTYSRSLAIYYKKIGYTLLYYFNQHYRERAPVVRLNSYK